MQPWKKQKARFGLAKSNTIWTNQRSQVFYWYFIALNSFLKAMRRAIIISRSCLKLKCSEYLVRADAREKRTRSNAFDFDRRNLLRAHFMLRFGGSLAALSIGRRWRNALFEIIMIGFELRTVMTLISDCLDDQTSRHRSISLSRPVTNRRKGNTNQNSGRQFKVLGP